jgi:hypothetical protein
VLELVSSRFKSLAVWLTPLTHSSFFLTALAVIINLPQVTRHMTAAAATLAFAGALYVTMAYRGRQYMLGYIGMALLELAWAILLFMNEWPVTSFGESLNLKVGSLHFVLLLLEALLVIWWGAPRKEKSSSRALQPAPSTFCADRLISVWKPRLWRSVLGCSLRDRHYIRHNEQLRGYSLEWSDRLRSGSER